MANEKTDALLESRRAMYGDRVTNMERVAQLWSALLNHTIEDWQVPLLMSAYKMLRTFETPDYSDNSDDIDGWKQMFVEVMEANHGGIVQARTVEEYHRLKEEAQTPAEREAEIDRETDREPESHAKWTHMTLDEAKKIIQRNSRAMFEDSRLAEATRVFRQNQRAMFEDSGVAGDPEQDAEDCEAIHPENPHKIAPCHRDKGHSGVHMGVFQGGVLQWR